MISSSTDRRLHWVLVIVLTLFALWLRGDYLRSIVVEEPLRADAAKYVRIALNLHRHGVYTHLADTSRPDYAITPGLPLLLYALHDGGTDLIVLYQRTLLLQAVLSALSVSLLFLLARRHLGMGSSLAAALLATGAPHLVVATGYVLTETLFVFVMLLALLVLDRARSPGAFAAAGLLFGLAALVRPVIVLFPLLITAWMAWRPAAAGCAAAVALLAGCVLVWALWSGVRASAPESGTPGESLALAALVFGSYPDLVHEDHALRGAPNRDDPLYEAMVRDPELALHALSGRIAAEPARYLRWYLLGKPVTFWEWSILAGAGGPFVYPVRDSVYHHDGLRRFSLTLYRNLHPLLVVTGLLWLPVLMWHARRQRSLSPGLFALAALPWYFTLVHTALTPLPRYSVPMHPLIFLGTCWLAADLCARLRAGRAS